MSCIQLCILHERLVGCFTSGNPGNFYLRSSNAWPNIIEDAVVSTDAAALSPVLWWGSIPAGKLCVKDVWLL